MTATELRQIQRLCQQILTQKHSDKFAKLTKLTMELYALLDRNKGDERGPSALPVNGDRHANGQNPYVVFARTAWLSDLLASAIVATGADFGGCASFRFIRARALRIAAQRGFENEFLNYFDTVGYDEGGACAAAMNKQARIVVADVATDPVFSGGPREMLLRSNVRSVQSTPLISPSGEFVGMLSTHHTRPQSPQPGRWQLVDELTAGFMAKT